MAGYTAEMLGATEVRFCEGCGEDVTMTLDRVDEYLRFRYFWRCPEFEVDGDYDGEAYVDLTNWDHTEDAL